MEWMILHGTIMREKIFHMAGVTDAGGTNRRSTATRHSRSRPRASAARQLLQSSLAGEIRRCGRQGCAGGGRRTGLRLRWPSRLRCASGVSNTSTPGRSSTVGAARCISIIRRRFAGELAAGELDVALVSSFEYLRNPIYSIVDRVAIASDGPVFSVILAHLGPIEGCAKSWSILLRRHRSICCAVCWPSGACRPDLSGRRNQLQRAVCS